MKKLFLLMSLSFGLLLPGINEAAEAMDNAPQGAVMSQDAGRVDHQSYQDGYRGGYQGRNQAEYQGGSQAGYQGGSQGNVIYHNENNVDPSQEYCCQQQPAEQNCGDCYCLYCRYEPCYYNTWRTECEPRMCCKKCCRMVPKYYDKCCVRYVPQQYTQCCCKYEPEYYYVNECKYVNKKVCERHCKYVPRYYYKHICNPQPCAPAACCN